MTTFQRARTSTQISERKDEIIKAAKILFQKDGYTAVTFNNIATMTSIKRSTLYTYYQTTDEILLAWLDIELQTFSNALFNVHFDHHEAPVNASKIVSLFVSQPDILPLFSLLFNLIENNCRDEVLIAFKQNIISLYDALFTHFTKQFPQATVQEVSTFTNGFIPVLIGVYQSTYQTPKQKAALEAIGKIDFFPSFYELATLTLAPLIPNTKK